MAETDIAQTVVSDMTNQVDNFSVGARQTEGTSDQNETEWMNAKFPQWFGYYKKIPELKKAIDALAIWTVGKGFTTDNATQVLVDNIIGWGEDTFTSILWNMIVTKKVNGDSYAEIIRNDKGTLINLKPLDPGAMKIITNREGIIKRYELISKINKVPYKFKPEDILHLCNDRVADEIHGTSIVEACEDVILARNEAMADWRMVLHRNIVPVRIIEVDEDNPTKVAKLKAQYVEAINKGEVLIVPKGNVEIKDSNPVLQDALPTITYYENFFYQAVGVPRVIASSENYTESGSKVGFLTFEPILYS